MQQMYHLLQLMIRLVVCIKADFYDDYQDIPDLSTGPHAKESDTVGRLLPTKAE